MMFDAPLKATDVLFDLRTEHLKPHLWLIPPTERCN